MRRCGFSLVELMVACSISMFIMLSVLVVFLGVWTLAKGAADEMQCALDARFMRERLNYRLVEETGLSNSNEYGLVNAKIIASSGSELIAGDMDNFTFSTFKGDTDPKSAAVRAFIDWTPTSFMSRRFSEKGDHLQRIFLKKEYKKTTYYDCLVAVMCHTNQPTRADIVGVFCE